MSGQTEPFWIMSGQTVYYYGLDRVACLDRHNSFRAVSGKTVLCFGLDRVACLDRQFWDNLVRFR